MLTYAFFLSNRRESLVRAFRKKTPLGRDKKNLRNSEYSGFRLFGRIEWVPPLKTKKLLKVTRRTGK